MHAIKDPVGHFGIKTDFTADKKHFNAAAKLDNNLLTTDLFRPLQRKIRKYKNVDDVGKYSLSLSL
jgi:hypothetical protein